jgi:hypothetical protein
MAVAEREESPYIQNPVNTENIDAPEIPGPGAEQIEREDNYATNEEINSLVEKVRSGQWRETQETKRLQARYGDRNLNTWWNQMRLLLGGEGDFAYDAATGTAHHNIGTEVFRRVANVTWKTGKTAAIASLLGLATGGTGAVAGWMIGGSAVGRSFAEAWKGIAGHESRMREKILIARERYYQKAMELADRVPDVEPPNRAAMSEKELADYYKRRNAAIESLVNFIHDSEQNTVTFEQKCGGDPYIDTRVFGEPLPTRGEPGDPRQGGPAGPVLNTGTEVYQSSKVAPTEDRETLDTLEKDLESYNRRWEWIQEGLALVGGIGGGIHAMLTAKTHLAEQLARGEIVKMDLDHNGIYHGVQKVSEATKQALGMAQDYVFHYNNSAEMLQAMADKATVLPYGEAGSHVLNESLAPTLMKAAWGDLGRNAMTTLGALFARFAWRGVGTELGHKSFEERRNKMKVRHELERRRFQPEPRDSIVRNMAERELKPDFAIGQEWIFNDQDGNSHRIKIVDIVNRPPHQKLLVYTEFDPSLGTQIDPKTGEEKGLNVVRTIAPEDLLQKPGVDMISERGKDPVLAHDPIPEPPKPAEPEKKEEDKNKDKPKLKFKDGDKEVEKELADKQVVVLKAENKKDDRAYEYYEVTIDKDGTIHFQKFAFDADKRKRDNKGKPITYKKKEDMDNWLKARENKDKVKVDKVYDKFEDYEKSLKKD